MFCFSFGIYDSRWLCYFVGQGVLHHGIDNSVAATNANEKGDVGVVKDDDKLFCRGEDCAALK